MIIRVPDTTSLSSGTSNCRDSLRGICTGVLHAIGPELRAITGRQEGVFQSHLPTDNLQIRASLAIRVYVHQKRVNYGILR
jgi:hypothetical protein